MKATEEKVFKFIRDNELLPNNSKILIALSGGPDSIFALFFFTKFRAKYNLSISAAHINHSLRKNESDKDQEYCELICKELGVQLFKHKSDIKKHSQENCLSLEEAGRKVRYSFFENIVESEKCDLIITAHNKNDNVETVLFNMARGTGLKGAAGIPVKRKNIIRPFLCLDKKEILEYLNENKIKFRVDESNNENFYRRNILRNKIIPQFENEINSSAIENINHFSNIADESIQLIQQYVQQVYSQNVYQEEENIFLLIDEIIKNNRPLINELVKEIYLKNNYGEFSKSYSSNVYDLIHNQSGKSLELNDGLKVIKENDRIIFTKKCNTVNQINKSLSLKGITDIGFGTIETEVKNIDEIELTVNPMVEYFDAELFENELIIRNWKDGDRFIPLGMTGEKKVSDFLTDLKVSASNKSEQLLVLNGNEIIWVVGYRINNRYKLTKRTKKVVKLQVIEYGTKS